MARWQGFVINLARSPERLAVMRERLTTVGIPFERVIAVDGATSDFTKREINEARYIHCHGKYITASEIACYVSHVRAMEQFLESDMEYGLILEDDAILAPDTKAVIEDLIECASCWDVVKLSEPMSGSARCPMKVARLRRGMVAVNLFFHPCAAAYLVSRKGAERLVAGLLPMELPYDHAFTQFWRYGIRLYTFYPLPVRPGTGASTIDYAQVKKNRLPEWQRLPTHLYRVGLMARRFVYGVLAALRGRQEWREYFDRT